MTLGLTKKQALFLKALGFNLQLRAIGCIDKDFYDVYV